MASQLRNAGFKDGASFLPGRPNEFNLDYSGTYRDSDDLRGLPEHNLETSSLVMVEPVAMQRDPATDKWNIPSHVYIKLLGGALSAEDMDKINPSMKTEGRPYRHAMIIEVSGFHGITMRPGYMVTEKEIACFAPETVRLVDRRQDFKATSVYDKTHIPFVQRNNVEDPLCEWLARAAPEAYANLLGQTGEPVPAREPVRA